MTHAAELGLDETHEAELIELVAWLEQAARRKQHGFPKDSPGSSSADWQDLDFLRCALAAAIDLELHPEINAALEAALDRGTL
jgi:hypothetical protein